MADQPTLLVILGAGASFDCLQERMYNQREVKANVDGLAARPFLEVQPPLTDQLASDTEFYNEILSEWEAAQPVIDFLRKALLSVGQESSSRALTLEDTLYEYQSKSYSEVQRHMYAVRFYLRDLLWACTIYMRSASLGGGITNYTTLLRHLLEWCDDHGGRVCIVSFNYDLLLEMAMASMWGFNAFIEPSRYLDHDRVTVVKPHGSIQWHWPVARDGTIDGSSVRDHGRRSIDLALEFGLTEELRTLSSAPHKGERYSAPAMIPALALPIREKGAFVWPDSHPQHLESLEGSVVGLMTIGWRGLEPHFTKLLNPLLPEGIPTLIVTGGEQEQAREEINLIWHRLSGSVERPLDSTKGFTGGFSDLIAGTSGAEEFQWLLSEPA